MLIPVLNLLQVASDGSSIQLVDVTGNYSVSNPGGFGTPNPAQGAITAIILQLISLNDLSVISSYALTSGERTNLFTPAGAAFPFSDFPSLTPSTYSDGVYDIKYNPCFAGTGTVSYAASAKAFLLTNADTIFALSTGVVGFTLPGSNTIYYIDRNQPLTNTGGSVTIALPATIGTSVAYSIAYEGDLKILVDVAGDRCLTEDIGIWAVGGCIEDNFRDIWKRFAQRIALKSKFTQGYLYDAHELALSLADYCDTLKSGGPCC